MPTDKHFIAAIELGSSKVTGIVGQKEPDGAINILAVVQEPSSSFIRKGRIHNLPKTQSVISNIKKSLEQKVKKKINKVYVGIGGMGLHTESNTISRNFAERSMVTDEIIDTLYDENRQHQSADRVILETIPQEYKLGPLKTLEPVGVQTESIEGLFLNIITKKEVRENINKCFYDAGLQVADVPITFLALADEILTEPQRRSGCVFVDLGAETTSVAIFKNNILRHLAVIPLGGKNITKDITSLQIEENEAEKLKLQYGTALSDESEEKHAPIKLQVGETVDYEEFSGLVEARQEEIIANISEQIKISNYDKSQLIGGIIITGGAANMRNLDKAFLKYTGFDKDKIYFEKTIKTQLRSSNQFTADYKNGTLNSVIALIMKGEEDCIGNEINPNNMLFEDVTEKARKEEEEKKRKEEEEEKKRKEEEEKRKIEEAQAAAEAEAEAERKRLEKKNKNSIFKNIIGKSKNFFKQIVSEEDNIND